VAAQCRGATYPSWTPQITVQAGPDTAAAAAATAPRRPPLPLPLPPAAPRYLVGPPALFRGSLGYAMHCATCRAVTGTVEGMYDLPLSISGAVAANAAQAKKDKARYVSSQDCEDVTDWYLSS